MTNSQIYNLYHSKIDHSLGSDATNSDQQPSSINGLLVATVALGAAGLALLYPRLTHLCSSLTMREHAPKTNPHDNQSKPGHQGGAGNGDNRGEGESEEAFGGKYQGLAKLAEHIEGFTSGQRQIIVPPFMGLSPSEIDTILQEGTVSKKIKAFLAQFQDRPNAHFMVRSSSQNEDQAGQSNAGCFETVSNVENNPTALYEAIQTVAASFHSDNAKTQTSLFGITLPYPFNPSSPSNSSNPVSTSNPLTNSGAIVIQLMVGETAGDEQSLSVSGVGLMPDPRSHSEGIFNLNYALGHGEGVVGSHVATKETLGVIDPVTKSVHARTKSPIQLQRMAPTQATSGLSLHDNPKALQHAPLLPYNTIQSYAALLETLTQEHATGADIEFVSQGLGSRSELFVVQQRSQDPVNVSGNPHYVSEASLAKQSKHAQPVTIKSYSTYGVSTIRPNERIVADSLDDAFFKDYLTQQREAEKNGLAPAKIKAVFVNPPASPNAHAALMFRQQGITIVEMQNPVYTEKLRYSIHDVLLDEQRSTLLYNPDAPLNLTELELIDGRFQFPDDAIYSMTESSTPLNQDQLKSLRQLINLHATNLDNPSEPLTHPAPLKQIFSELKQEIARGPAMDRPLAKLRIAQLLAKTNTLLTFAHRTQQLPLQHIATELTLDLVRLADAIDQASDPMHPLLFLNWVDAALNQMPEEHPHLVGIESVSSEIRSIKTERQFNTWFKAVSLRHAGLDYRNQVTPNDRNPTSLNADTRSALYILYRLSYAINSPALKARWLTTLSNLARTQACPENRFMELAKRAIGWQQSENLSSVLGDTALHSDPDVISIDLLLADQLKSDQLLDTLKQANSQLALLKDDWSNPKGFEDRLKKLSLLHNLVKLCLNRLDPNYPHQSMTLTKEIEKSVEQFDLALKSIVTSQDYSQPSTEDSEDEISPPSAKKRRALFANALNANTVQMDHFTQLLTSFKTLVMPLLTTAFADKTVNTTADTSAQKVSNSIELSRIDQNGNDDLHSIDLSDSDDDSTNTGYSPAYKMDLATRYSQRVDQFETLFDGIINRSYALSLFPTPSFVVSAAVISRSVDSIYSSAPYSIGDLHTLLHQNARVALGKLTINNNALSCLPQKAQEMHHRLTKSIQTTLSRLIGNADFWGEWALTSITTTEQGYEWQCAQPLRDHGIRFAFSLDQQKQQLTVAIAMDGLSEHNRYEITTSLVQHARKRPIHAEQFQSGKTCWPDHETSHDNTIRWVEDFSDTRSTEAICDHLSALFKHVIDTSLEFAEGTFDMDDHHASSSIIYMLYGLLRTEVGTGNQPDLSLTQILDSKEIEDVVEILHPYLMGETNDDDSIASLNHSGAAILNPGALSPSPINSAPINSAPINLSPKVTSFSDLDNNSLDPSDGNTSVISFSRSLKLDHPISKAELKTNIENSGLLNGDIGIYEFHDLLKARYSKSHVLRMLASEYPSTFWQLNPQQQNDLHQIMIKSPNLDNRDFLHQLLPLIPALAEMPSIYNCASSFYPALQIVANLTSAKVNPQSIVTIIQLLTSISGEVIDAWRDTLVNSSENTLTLIHKNQETFMKIRPTQLEQFVLFHERVIQQSTGLSQEALDAQARIIQKVIKLTPKLVDVPLYGINLKNNLSPYEGTLSLLQKLLSLNPLPSNLPKKVATFINDIPCDKFTVVHKILSNWVQNSDIASLEVLCSHQPSILKSNFSEQQYEALLKMPSINQADLIQLAQDKPGH